MQKNLFNYRAYKEYLRDRVTACGRGEKSRIAEALRCHLAYISQVLGADAQLSLEQADSLSAYLGHTEDESEYLLLLVSHARAGTASLRKTIESRIRKIHQDRALLENRIKNRKTLPFEAQATYYGAWYYSAVHLLISVPGYQTKEAIARHLNLPMQLVTQVLDLLTSTGLASFAKGHYQSGQASLHLTNDSPWIARHHASWRMRAIQAAETTPPNDPRSLLYTSVVSMSPDDAPEVRKILIEAIEKVRTVVRKSPEKAVYCYTLDLFPV